MHKHKHITQKHNLIPINGLRLCAHITRPDYAPTSTKLFLHHHLALLLSISNV